ncbi:excalibur calcium-binding domain-containing protein [Deinococcus petrolearius]|uniref:Excalibur calcium-binding domain-containing protein n=1 Tax=Deinococcus petrolearius TaxID=1751295 RepID=A0ABW1DLR8_9DEIO
MKHLLFTLALALTSPALAADLTIRFLDVGQGDAVLVTTPDGKTMLYDAGRRGGRAAGLLRSYGVRRLDLAVMSQGDADHIGGFIEVAPLFKPRAFLNNGLAKSTQTYAAVIAAFKSASTPGLLASERTINLGTAVKLQVLPAPQGVPKNNHNANSVGVVLTYGTFRAFLGGDAEPNTLRGWQEKYATLLRNVDLYKAAHHGSKHNDTATFVTHLSPSIVGIGVGKNNYGHPSPEALLLYRKAGAAIYRTDLNGTITVTVKANGTYTVTAERGLGTQGTTRSTAPQPSAPAPALPSGVSYRNCTEAKAAGAAPLRRGQPGYSTSLDRDGDGVACER